MLRELLDAIGVWLGIRAKVAPDLTGILVLCDSQEVAYEWMHWSVWAMLLCQLIILLILGPSWVNAASSVVVAFCCLIVIRGYSQATDTVRSSTQLSLTLQRVVDAQGSTIESQRETIERLVETNEALRKENEALQNMINQMEPPRR